MLPAALAPVAPEAAPAQNGKAAGGDAAADATNPSPHPVGVCDVSYDDGTGADGGHVAGALYYPATAPGSGGPAPRWVPSFAYTRGEGEEG